MSKIAKPGGGGPPDQRKIYLDWANHYLRKSGQGAMVLSDLKEIADGHHLPKIIQAVVNDKVPGVTQPSTSDNDRVRNVEACIKFLKEIGVNCSTFKSSDIAEGNMKAILSLFYNLSQIKKPARNSQSGPDSTHQTSRIARPVSPGLKSSHGVNGSIPKGSTLPTPTITNGNSSSPGIGRRTAGSSILTSTTPYSMRRVPYKPVTGGGDSSIPEDSSTDPLPSSQRSQFKDKAVTNGYHSSSGEHDTTSTTPLKSPSDPLKSKPSKLSKLSAPKESKLVSPSSPNQTKDEGVKEVRSKTLPHPSKLQTLVSQRKLEEGSGRSDSVEDVSRPQSRLKLSASGRSTPSGNGRSTPSGGRSGLMRPSSRLGKEDGGRDESKLKLVRKGSDGAVKRHKVNQTIASVPGVGVIEPGTSALPHVITPSQPHTSARNGSGLPTPETSQKQKTDMESSSSSSEHNTPTSAEGKSGSGLKKPAGGLRRPGGGGFGFGGSAVKQSSSNTTEELSREGHSSSETNPPKKLATVEKKPSFSKLSRFGAHSKLAPNTHHSHPSQPSQASPKSHNTQATGSSNSSLDSADIKLATSPKLSTENSKKELVKLEIPDSTKSSTSDLISPPLEFKEAANNDTEKSSTHPRFGRRISPEGMSHEETTSPRDLNNSLKNDEQSDKADSELNAKNLDSIAAVSRSKKLSQPETGQTESLESPMLAQKQGQSSISTDPAPSTNNDNREFTHPEATIRAGRQEHLTSPTIKSRARSLSPKTSHRVIAPPTSQDYTGSSSSSTFEGVRSGSSEELPQLRGPLKSSLRGSRAGKRAGMVKRSPSTSSGEGSVSSSPSRPKVVISPRSSQLVYDPTETGLSGSYGNQPTKLSPDQPFADTLSVSSAPEAYQSPVLNQHSSLRSTLSERLDYQEQAEFLEKGMPAKTDKPSSNPELELIGTFENQLSSMRKDLASKEQMLSMYETSMADLSSKVHHLKKTLDEKDREIRQLTDEKASVLSQSQWYDYDGRSIALDGRSLASRAEVLSDGCLSDGAMEGEKEGKKKKKSWKLFKKSKGKEGKESLSASLDTDSIISGRSGRGLRRTLSAKRKTPDLMSISEYAEPRYRDFDTKSTYTLDTRSEYAMPLPMVWADEPITVHHDESPGAKVTVYLQPELDEVVIGNDSGFYGDGMSRHGSNNSGLHRDSLTSGSSDSVGMVEGGLVLGTLSVAPETSWVTMDTKIGNIFMHHLNAMDQEGCLGLTEDSIHCYIIGDQRRAIGNALLPLLTPHQAVADGNQVRILIRGSGQESCDSLAYKTLMNAETLQSYMNMLQETRWLVVMGTKGTCKTSLASGLARHLSLCVTGDEYEGVEDVHEGTGGEIVSFNLDKEGIESPLKYIKTELVKRTQLPLSPPILLLEDGYECSQLEAILVAAETLPTRPYIIATLCSGTTKGIPLHQLLFHHQIRVVTCNPSTEPVAGILARSLRKQVYQLKATTKSDELDGVAERLVRWLPHLLDHLNQFINKFHSSSVNLGPRVFMGCPLNHPTNELESWFLNLWNYFLIPYLMGAIMAGIETYTADPHMVWIDVREWVVDSYPWQPSFNLNKLRTLNPEDVGWNHAVRPQQNRLMIMKDEDTRSLLHA